MFMTKVNANGYTLLAMLVNEIRELTGEDCVFGYRVTREHPSFDVAWPNLKVALDIQRNNEWELKRNYFYDRIEKHRKASGLGWIVFHVAINSADIGGLAETISNIIVNRRRNIAWNNLETKSISWGDLR